MEPDLPESRSGAEKLTAALQRAADSLFDFEIAVGTEEIALTLAVPCPNPALLPRLSEQACCLTIAVASWLFGPKAEPERIEFAYPPPAHAGSCAEFFCCPVRFDAQATSVHFHKTALTLPSAGRVRRSRIDQPRTDIAPEVEQVLRDRIWEPTTQAAVAKRLMMSERTLHRRLAEGGQRFGEIRDRVRLERANVLLRTSSLSISAIAGEVGFTDAREFRRAYLRWTGSTPSAARAASPWRPEGPEDHLPPTGAH
ncbi:AraC family transcriptional regulator [Nocardia panacis]|uniref:AraC family transcriptional regulator n=1 Tax=Nocardia panacis TaxID=2340916 RepID=A0A3A4K896_9NOCA|nr:AraC family transcriptional regulator [Nocardia panacis]RJO77547.1 AraC family transcriptional regulator [Nocardia panacis]